MAERDPSSNNNITMNALTDSQLEDSLDAILFDPAFGGTGDELNVNGDSSITCRTSANSGGLPLPALHSGETMSLPNSFAGGQKTRRGSHCAPMPTMNLTGEMPPVGDRSRTTTPSANPAADVLAPPPGGSDVKTAKPQSAGAPQLFGRTLPFSVPLAPTDRAAGVPKVPPPSSMTNTVASGKRKREESTTNSSMYAVSEDESERERRRQGRNHREQQRSQQISNQIVVLRSLLAEARVECKADKHSTLASVVDYVQSLQKKSSMLDSEHSKLLETIRHTTEIMNSQYMSVQADPSSTVKGGDAAVIGKANAKDEDEVFVQGLDYESIFRASPFALATTSIDGRFLDCSEGFERLTKFSRQELLPAETEKAQPSSGDDSSITTSDISSGNTSGSEDPKNVTKNLSLFNVLFQSDMGPVYHAMYDILQQPVNHMDDSTSGDSEDDEPARERRDRWSNDVRLSRDKEARVKLYLNLVRTMQERPRFFNCTIVADENAKSHAPRTAYLNPFSHPSELLLD